VKVPPGVSLKDWEGLGPEVLSAPNTDGSIANLVRGVRNIPTALQQISRHPSNANKYLVTPAAAGLALGAEGGPVSAGVGGLVGALMGLMSYGNPAANKLVQSATDLTSLPGPASLGMVSTGGKVLSKVEHDALSADYYLDKLPKIAKQVKGKFFNANVEDLVGDASIRLQQLFEDKAVKDFPDDKALNDYLSATGRGAMEDSARRTLASTGDELTPEIANTTPATAIPTEEATIAREKTQTGLDKLLSSFLRPRDQEVFRRTSQATTIHEGNRPVQSSIRSLAKELKVNPSTIERAIPEAKSTMEYAGKRLKSTMAKGGFDLDTAVSNLVDTAGPDYGQIIKGYRKDFSKLYSPEILQNAVARLPQESQGPMTDYLRGFTPAQLERKWDGDSTPDKLYHAFKALEEKL
jgi:hypothetical protein